MPEKKRVCLKKMYTWIERFFNPEKDALYLIHAVVEVSSKNKIQKVIRAMRKNKLVRKYGIFIGENVKIGDNLKLPHPHGIVIGKDVEIGNDVIIYQNVTLGATRRGDEKKGLYPKIGDGCCIFAGSIIVGKVNVEDNVVVGANSVLLSDAQKDGVYVGTPAKMVNKR